MTKKKKKKKKYKGGQKFFPIKDALSLTGKTPEEFQEIMRSKKIVPFPKKDNWYFTMGQILLFAPELKEEIKNIFLNCKEFKWEYWMTRKNSIVIKKEGGITNV